MVIEYKTLKDRTIYICTQQGVDYFSVTMLSNGMALLNGRLDTAAAIDTLNSYIAAGTPVVAAK